MKKKLSDEEKHVYLCTCLEELVMTTIDTNEIYDVSYCTLSFDCFMFKDDYSIIYYKDGKEIFLSDNEVLNEIWSD